MYYIYIYRSIYYIYRYMKAKSRSMNWQFQSRWRDENLWVQTRDPCREGGTCSGSAAPNPASGDHTLNSVTFSVPGLPASYSTWRSNEIGGAGEVVVPAFLWVNQTLHYWILVHKRHVKHMQLLPESSCSEKIHTSAVQNKRCKMPPGENQMLATFVHMISSVY